MDSDPGGIGLLGSVERCFVLGWGPVVAVAVEPVLVEPVHPGQGGELELVDDEEISLVVMSTHGHGGVTRAWVGSVADRMVRKGTAPVLLARPADSGQGAQIAPGPPFRKILVPLDGSPLAEAALDRSTLPVPSGDAEIVLLHVVGLLSSFGSPDGPLTPDLTGQILEAERDAALAYLEGVAERVAPWGFRVTPHAVLAPSAWAGIVEFASVG